jgi:hypothetical protein
VVATPRAPALRWGALAVIAAVLGCEHSLIVGPARRLDPALLVEAPPPFFAELARQPGRHPLLQLPLAGDGYLLWVPYHRQPVDGGIADGDPYLAPQAYAERLAREPVLAALGRLGRGETVAPMPDAETRICALGFHYAVLHARGAVPAGTVAHCRAALPDFFGRAPDRSEGLIQVWRMRPCAGDGP